MAKIAFTAPRVAGLSCPPDKAQAFLWDSKAPGLGLRVTPRGRPAYIFQSLYQGKSLRITIGDAQAWRVPDAQAKARELQRQIDEGRDPRAIKAERVALDVAKREADRLVAVTVGDAWPTYLSEGSPKRRDTWKPRYRADLEAMAAAGGIPKKRGKGLTRPGPVYPLLAMALVDVNEDTLKAWFDIEAIKSKHQAARGLMMFRGFLRWCSTKPKYRGLVDRNAGSAPALTSALPQVKKRKDALQRAQVRGWWSGVEQLDNLTASVYLLALFLTGARREELAALPWDEVDFRWRKLTIADKVDDSRVIPLTPFLAHILAALPRTNRFVFASTGKAGHLSDVRSSHAKVLKHAGIEHLTFHGLRRSFIQIARGVVPAGVPAQIAGHKPSATAEGYAILTLDDLRPYAEQIEAHFLELAGVQFVAGK